MALMLAPSRLKPVPLNTVYTRRTGFGREDIGRDAARLRMLQLASSRLKPVPLG
jgi:hypothetical protein